MVHLRGLRCARAMGAEGTVAKSTGRDGGASALGGRCATRTVTSLTIDGQLRADSNSDGQRCGATAVLSSQEMIRVALSLVATMNKMQGS